MRNVKTKLTVASILLCGSVAIGITSLRDVPVASASGLEGFEVKSASLRVPDEEYGAGIRFTIGLDNADVAEGASAGVLLIPTASLGDSDLTLDLDNQDLRVYNDIEWTTLEDGTKEAYLHLYDIPAVQYTSNISMCAFIDHDADPATDPLYTDVAKASVAQVADWAYNYDETLDEDEKATVQSTYLTYKVFYHNDEEVTETTGVYNQTIEAIAEPTKNGYKFAGWWNKAGTHEWNFDTTKVTSTTTNLYAKWEEDIDPVVAARVGDDANTLFFFNKDFGVSQAFNVTGKNYGYTTEMAYGDEEGSLRITWPGNSIHNTVDIDFKDYQFGSDDYVEFYIYNATDVGTLTMRFSYENATYLTNGEWTRVIGKASWLQSNKYFRFVGQSGNHGSNANVGGSIYISKVKVYSGFADLTAATGEWKIGETTFTGAASVYNTPAQNAMQKSLYQTANDSVTMTLWSHSYAGFYAKLKNSVDATSEYKYLSVTAKGADASLFTIVGFNTAGSAKTSATYPYTTRDEGNGFTTYIFRFKGFEAGSFRFTPMGNTTEAAFAKTSGNQIVISNVAVGGIDTLRRGKDANTVFFADPTLGADLKQFEVRSGENITSGSFTTEKVYGDEKYSFKTAGIKHGTIAYMNFNVSDADKAFLSDTDYVVFYVYTTSSTRFFMSVNYKYATTGWEVMPNAWNRIVMPASEFKAGTWMMMHPSGLAADGTYFDTYFSRVARYTAEEVTKLENKGSTDTWTLGSTTFVGAPSISNGGGGDGYAAGTEHKKAYIIDDELSITFVRTGDGNITFTLAESIEVAAGTDMYVTVTMYDYGRLDKIDGYFFGSGTNHLSYVSHEDIGGGYAKVVLKIAAKDSDYTITKVRLDADGLSGDTNGLASQFRIKDIVIDSKAN